MLKHALISLFVASSVYSGIALAEEESEFTYKINNYPAVGDCHEAATRIAAVFKERTKITPVESRCVDINDYGFNIEIDYLAVKKLELISTVPTYIPYAVSPAGYESKDTCMVDLPTETALFRGKTGLTSVVAYCYQEAGTRKDPWVLRIDAFGAADARPYLTGTLMLELPASTDLPSIRDGIKARLTSRGVDVRFIKIRGNNLQGEMSILYYAPKSFKIELTQHVKVHTREHCDEQLELSRSIFATAPSAPLSLYCASGMIGGTYYVMGFYQNASGLKVVDAPQRFVAYAPCMASREEILAGYKARLGEKVVGALCSRQDDGPFDGAWRVRIITK